ncbi:unnamed protein product [Pleuronectes platessa]|uniref:Uncharacterized protein n=1 Tax=Pleuronectes platessa TaxID=8262 RepID=A0A9N7Z587_PLEPL|nr:unnamed protein product [Pleuronectes platessa]
MTQKRNSLLNKLQFAEADFMAITNGFPQQIIEILQENGTQSEDEGFKAVPERLIPHLLIRPTPYTCLCFTLPVSHASSSGQLSTPLTTGPVCQLGNPPAVDFAFSQQHQAHSFSDLAEDHWSQDFSPCHCINC